MVAMLKRRSLSASAFALAVWIAGVHTTRAAIDEPETEPNTVTIRVQCDVPEEIGNAGRTTVYVLTLVPGGPVKAFGRVKKVRFLASAVPNLGVNRALYSEENYDTVSIGVTGTASIVKGSYGMPDRLEIAVTRISVPTIGGYTFSGQQIHLPNVNLETGQGNIVLPEPGKWVQIGQGIAKVTRN